MNDPALHRPDDLQACRRGQSKRTGDHGHDGTIFLRVLLRGLAARPACVLCGELATGGAAFTPMGSLFSALRIVK